MIEKDLRFSKGKEITECDAVCGLILMKNVARMFSRKNFI